MAAERLQTELLAVPGVAAAEVEPGNGTALAGVKVRLAPDADARRVGVEVQRVLAAHGMRSRFASEPQPAEPPMPPDSSSLEPIQPPPAPSLSPPVEPPPPPMPHIPARAVVAVPDPPSGIPPAPVAVSNPELLSVSVEESRDGLTATIVLADGRRAVGTASGDGEELDAAIIGAIAEAVGERVTTAAVEWLEVENGNVVTVVINRADGSLAAGADVVRIGRAFAVGLATQSALDG